MIQGVGNVPEMREERLAEAKLVQGRTHRKGRQVQICSTFKAFLLPTLSKQEEKPAPR